FGIARDSEDLTVKEARTMATMVLISVGLWVLVLLARPFTRWRALLVGAMVAGAGIVFAAPGLRHFYERHLPEFRGIGIAALVAFAAIVALEIGWRFSRTVGRRWSARAPADTAGIEPVRGG